MSEVEKGAARWVDVDHNRPADVYTPPERQYCSQCGMARLLHDANFVTGDVLCPAIPLTAEEMD